MMKLRGAVIVFILFIWLMLAVSLNAMEPQKPETDHIFGLKEEQKIMELTAVSLDESFKQMKTMDFLTNEDLLHKAIFEAFGYRKKEAVDYALNILQLPEKKKMNGKLLIGANDFYLAKKIFEVFPDESAAHLVSLYKKGTVATKANVIMTLSKIAGGGPIRKLLIDALDDKTPVENDNPGMDGIPLRICDMAYNQLVLRYKIKNVLRTIGTVHGTEVRQYHIDILKNML
jgi:hypothetical protein